ncbi:hypothetical protein BU16DRAFT_558221 [Lophium mytilinum]|uniref:Uncharacterized protein n=1 Tax=Lophium mytilinum TaxID=390894 RepID=A0A6A6R0Y0_9PEZI|nr:hypothetical protein BU16DRAFT_558221 [Lophium mytilinum]
MLLPEVPRELLWEVADYLPNRSLKNLIEVHSLLHLDLQSRLHQRAISTKPTKVAHIADRDPLEEVAQQEGPLEPAMRWAIRYRHISLVQYLLRHNTNNPDSMGNWPVLDWLMEHDRAPVDIINTVLQHATVHAMSIGRISVNREEITTALGQYLRLVPMHLLGDEDYDDLEGSLCEHGKFCECIWDVSEAELDVVRSLLQLGADPMGRGYKYPLDDDLGGLPIPPVFTFQARNEQILKILVQAGADIHWQCPNTGTALYRACYKDFPSTVVKFFLELGADPNCTPNAPLLNGLTPAPLAIVINRDQPLKANMLLDYNVESSFVEENGEADIHILDALTPSPASIRVYERVIARTPHIDVEAGGDTALQMAMDTGRLHLARSLVVAGADIGIVEHERSTLDNIARMDMRQLYAICNRLNFLIDHAIKLSRKDIIRIGCFAYDFQRNNSRLWMQTRHLRIYWEVFLNAFEALTRFGPSQELTQIEQLWEADHKDIERRLGDEHYIRWSSEEWDICRQNRWWMDEKYIQ